MPIAPGMETQQQLRRENRQLQHQIATLQARILEAERRAETATKAARDAWVFAKSLMKTAQT